MQSFRYLALGDSYTIGEQVQVTHNFPYLFISKLRKYTIQSGKQISFAAPEIVAKTGWTTDELSAGMDNWIFDGSGYDMVSLLIGVNNQYRGRGVEEYEKQFSVLLQRAVDFARGINGNVYVLSVPDWGITPFAHDRNKEEIALQIDEFNRCAQSITQNRGCHFIDITTEQRKFGNQEAYLAPDGLHPSGKEYNKWADKLFEEVMRRF